MARATGAFGHDAQQVLRDDGTCLLRASAHQHVLFTIDIDFDGAPFRRELSLATQIRGP